MLSVAPVWVTAELLSVYPLPSTVWLSQLANSTKKRSHTAHQEA
jgi:hypothetical protein